METFAEDVAKIKGKLDAVQRWSWGMNGLEKNPRGEWIWSKDAEAKVAEVAYLAYKAGLECGLKIGNL